MDERQHVLAAAEREDRHERRAAAVDHALQGRRERFLLILTRGQLRVRVGTERGLEHQHVHRAVGEVGAGQDGLGAEVRV